MKGVLYRPSWQKLRVSCLAANSQLGGFNSDIGTDDNLKRLNNYLIDASNPSSIPDYVQQEIMRMGNTLEEEYACRIWRILNMLNAVRMGFSGQGRANTSADRAVEAYRNEIQEQYNGSLVVRAEDHWNWDVVLAELETMWISERVWFDRIYDDLSRRRKVATKRRVQVGRDDITTTRAELVKFLNLMDEVNRHAQA